MSDDYWDEVRKQIAENQKRINDQLRKEAEAGKTADQRIKDAASRKHKHDDPRFIHERDQRHDVNKLAKKAKKHQPKAKQASKSGCLVWISVGMPIFYVLLQIIEIIKSI